MLLFLHLLSPPLWQGAQTPPRTEGCSSHLGPARRDLSELTAWELRIQVLNSRLHNSSSWTGLGISDRRRVWVMLATPLTPQVD